MTADQIGLKVAPTKLTVDHVVPVREIVDMDGFAVLLWADQKAIVNMRENLIAMDGLANSYKSDWSWRSWPQASRFYREEAIDQMIAREDTVRGLIRQGIEKRLTALRTDARA